MRLGRTDIDRLNALAEIRVQRRHIVIRELSVGGVRHRRIEVRAVRPHTFAQRAGELRFGVVADPVRLRGRDVAGVDGAERRVDGVATGERLAAVWLCVAGRAVAGDRQVAPARNQIRFRRPRARRGRQQQQAYEQKAHQVRPRVETQLGPPGDDGRERDGRSEIPGEFVVSCSDSAPIFELAEHTFDGVALPVWRWVERMRMLTRRVVEYRAERSSFDQVLTKSACIVGLIGQE